MFSAPVIDWTAIPAPINDDAAQHLLGAKLPDITLKATDGQLINLSTLKGKTVLYAYPRTARPGTPSLEGWDMIPGAKGCTPQSCAFRDHYQELRSLGITNLFGIFTQNTEYQSEAVGRLHLPFSLLSDDHFVLTEALRFPTFTTSDVRLLKRFTLIIEEGVIKHVIYPVFPPDKNAEAVVTWLHSQANVQQTTSTLPNTLKADSVDPTPITDFFKNLSISTSTNNVST
jgi:peroxiredoxin